MTYDRTYRVIVEEYKDGRMIRRFEEWQNKLEQDSTDGEETFAMVLAKAIQWFVLTTGCTGFATACYIGKWLGNQDSPLFKAIAAAYEEWDCEYEWDDCVSLHVDRRKLCGESADPS